jgi:hypothetical protein
MNAGERKAGYPNMEGYAKRKGSYGLSHHELEEVRRAQVANENPVMVEAIGGREGYEVPAHEFLYVYHVEVEENRWDPDTGNKVGKPVIKKFNIDSFKMVTEQGIFQGYSTVILHDPVAAQEYNNMEIPEKPEDE